MGLVISSSYRQRVQNLRRLASFLQCLEAEMNYAHTTLPEIIGRQKREHTGVIYRFLVRMERLIEAGTGESFPEIWVQGLGVLKANGLPGWLLEDLRHLGIALGQSDVAEQTKHLLLLQKRLEQALTEAQGEQGKHTKLWSYLGFFGGLLLVLLLF